MKAPFRGAAVALVAAGAMLLSACGSSGANTAGGGDNPPATTGSTSGPGAGQMTDVKLMLNWYPYGAHAPLYYGLKQGIFKKQGINLTIVPGKGSGPVAQAIGQKHADFGWVDTPAVLSNVQAGVPIKSVGVFYQTTPSAVQFFCSQNIKKPQDLKGKKIAATAGGAFAIAFPAFLEANGMTTSDVNIINVTPAAKISSVISGQTDALLGFVVDQGPTIQQKTGKKMCALKFADWGLKYLGPGLVANNDTIKNDAGLVKRMVQAVSDSFTAALAASDDDVVASMEGASPNLPPVSVLKESWDRGKEVMSTTNTKDLPPGANSEKDWQQTIKIYKGLGQLKGDPKPSDFWDSAAAPTKSS